MPGEKRLLRCTECGERDADFVVSGANRVGCFKTAHLFRGAACYAGTRSEAPMNRVLLFALIILAPLWALADIDTRSKPEARVTATVNGARG